MTTIQLFRIQTQFVLYVIYVHILRTLIITRLFSIPIILWTTRIENCISSKYYTLSVTNGIFAICKSYGINASSRNECDIINIGNDGQAMAETAENRRIIYCNTSSGQHVSSRRYAFNDNSRRVQRLSKTSLKTVIECWKRIRQRVLREIFTTESFARYYADHTIVLK